LVKKDEVTGDWWKIHNEELNDLYCLPKIFRVIESRRMIWAGHVGRMEKSEAYTKFWWEDLRERDRLGDPVVEGRIMFKMDIQKVERGVYGLDRVVS
jgi:hypothetical protein